jgi:hypothetical protein
MPRESVSARKLFLLDFFFASDYANWIAGQVLSIDGGKLLSD